MVREIVQGLGFIIEVANWTEPLHSFLTDIHFYELCVRRKNKRGLKQPILKMFVPCSNTNTRASFSSAGSLDKNSFWNKFWSLFSVPCDKEFFFFFWIHVSDFYTILQWGKCPVLILCFVMLILKYYSCIREYCEHVTLRRMSVAGPFLFVWMTWNFFCLLFESRGQRLLIPLEMPF